MLPDRENPRNAGCKGCFVAPLKPRQVGDREAQRTQLTGNEEKVKARVFRRATCARTALYSSYLN